MFESFFGYFTYIFSSIEKHIALILLIITAIHVYIAYNSSRIMKKQLEVDVRISNSKLGSELSNKKFIKKIKDDNPDDNKSINFLLSVDVCNRAAGNCSISKPYLIINFPDGYEAEVKPKSKDVEIQNVGDVTKEVIKDFGNTVYLKSRDFVNLELEYKKLLGENLHQHIIDYSNDLKYFMEYVDNFENKHRLPIENVFDIEESARYMR